MSTQLSTLAGNICKELQCTSLSKRIVNEVIVYVLKGGHPSAIIVTRTRNAGKN